MPRAKVPNCLYCDKKRARLGKERGYEHHRFCSIQCGFRYGMERTMGMVWCAQCDGWFDAELGVPHKHDGSDTEDDDSSDALP